MTARRKWYPGGTDATHTHAQQKVTSPLSPAQVCKRRRRTRPCFSPWPVGTDTLTRTWAGHRQTSRRPAAGRGQRGTPERRVVGGARSVSARSGVAALSLAFSRLKQCVGNITPPCVRLALRTHTTDRHITYTRTYNSIFIQCNTYSNPKKIDSPCYSPNDHIDDRAVKHALTIYSSSPDIWLWTRVQLPPWQHS